MELRGPWRIAPVGADLTRTGADPDLDDSDWPELGLPGHWGELPGFDPGGRPVMHRLRWSPAPLPAGRRRWLTLEGVISQADIWLDGRYLGDAEGPHAPTRFEITDASPAPDDPTPVEHTLAIEVVAPRPAGDRGKRIATGSLQTGALAPTADPGGLWRPVHLADTGPVAIRHRRLTCTHASTDRAELSLHLVLDAVAAGDVEVMTTVVAVDGKVTRERTTHTLAGGENRLDWTLGVDEPALWWPAGLGDQPQYQVTVVVLVDDEASDHCGWRTGLRSVEVDGFRWKINGEQLFVKGITIGPQSAHLGSIDPDRLVSDLRRAADAGLDLVRLHGHVTRPEVYEAADELGILIWQDLPFVGSYATTTRELARNETRAIVDRLTHHPSVALWCVHDEPNAAPVPATTTHRRPTGALVRHVGRHLLPSWSRNVLDPLLRRELRAADPSRPVVLHSGGLPGLGDPSGSDPHLWLGWRTGSAEDLGPTIRRWPGLGRFLGGFGAQSVVLGPDQPDGPTFPRAEREAFERTSPRGTHTSAAAWGEATQSYQAELIRHHIETIRRLKYSPAGGFCLTALVDAERGGGFGVYDLDRRPKRARDTLVDACRDVVVIADRPSATSAMGVRLDLDLHVVSDRRDPLHDVTITAIARLDGDEVISERSWSGDIGADAVEFVATWAVDLPDRTGVVTIDLAVHGDDVVASNRYRTVLVPADDVGTHRRFRRN